MREETTVQENWINVAIDIVGSFNAKRNDFEKVKERRKQ